MARCRKIESQGLGNLGPGELRLRVLLCSRWNLNDFSNPLREYLEDQLENLSRNHSNAKARVALTWLDSGIKRQINKKWVR